MTTGATAQNTFIVAPRENDPYRYQAGFGNRFASEAIPGALPVAQNNPKKVKYDLYTESINGTSFVAPRAQNQFTWTYRMRPSVAHNGFTKLPDNPDLEANFHPSNPRVHFSPTQLAWSALDIPPANQKVDFVAGLKTLAGNGDPTSREGLATHVFAANTSMEKTAFCNADGDMMILPQLGRLDIQTEFGKLMVRPGELVVVQRGLKFKISLPDGHSRGYVQEIFGSHYELPELGPVGANGLANPRDFESPVASFDIDRSPWEIIYKVGGQLFVCNQDHTPFDVVAWHGNYIPYKYDLDKFAAMGSILKDHADPSIYCVLTAKSKTPAAPLIDFVIFSPRWDATRNTFRPPFFHRNCATEMLGIIHGSYGGRSEALVAGSLSYESGFCPHGLSYKEFKAGTEAPDTPQIVYADTLMIMFESCMQTTVTDYAMNRSGNLHKHDPEMWKDLKAQFLDHVDEINADLQTAGLPKLRGKL
ncbi:Homogentisate 1,2-dioxygenase [Sparassis crispa]|uniref:homogentisate 1,2-dioxygenase n=1 Tax=Sparassis crispa TaxID=139825 RepID=A0A401H2E1_9APHY|nr:Homogentisate 1,2-dioxygenase [Sparassis crispa]GBE88553.1 Homogentisate 1,2-dioxygenase [Sparassis crispa]